MRTLTHVNIVYISRFYFSIGYSQLAVAKVNNIMRTRIKLVIWQKFHNQVVQEADEVQKMAARLDQLDLAQ